MDSLIFLGMIAAGFIFGRLNEKKHFKSILIREKHFASIPMVPLKKLPDNYQIQSSMLVHGSVVVSVDYFKRMIASLVNIFGGEMKSYSSLIDRARREAILRMKEKAPRADMFLNMKIETASISKGENKSIGSVEVLCYATAIKLKS